MSGRSGFSLRIFIPSGQPEGLRIVEKSNWIGQGMVFPRASYGEARQREELRRTGVYVLWGARESPRLPRIYVGEGDTLLSRLDQHARNKDFWTHAVVFTSKDHNLTKAHGQYLEAALVALARDAKRCELDNGNVPQRPLLSQADTADAEGFLSDLLLCLPQLGVTFFERPLADSPAIIELVLDARGIQARGYESAEGFVVLAGSRCAKHETPSIHSYLAELRSTLIANGVLEDSGESYRMTQDYTFASPSSAAGVLLGRATNGRIDWKHPDGRSLKDLQDEATGS